jgi:O-acetyl-ADP-ribose deacetylase (regulator of RNase III)
MIRYIEGDIFRSPAQVLVNTVNTAGVMEKEIALEFKKRYPDMFQIIHSQSAGLYSLGRRDRVLPWTAT